MELKKEFLLLSTFAKAQIRKTFSHVTTIAFATLATVILLKRKKLMFFYKKFQLKKSLTTDCFIFH